MNCQELLNILILLPVKKLGILIDPYKDINYYFGIEFFKNQELSGGNGKGHLLVTVIFVDTRCRLPGLTDRDTTTGMLGIALLRSTQPPFFGAPDRV